MQYSRAILLSLTLALSQPSCSGLPTQVDGTPLPSLAPMLEAATPAVVNISTQNNPPSPGYTLTLDRFFRQLLIPEKRQQKSQSLGSGVIVDANKGYLVTNYHVIKEASVIHATLSNGTKLLARLVGYDAATDIALLQINAPKLTALPLANSNKHRVGDFVVAIGNPFGLGQTVTSGIISALGRNNIGIEGYENFIQTDAAINPGNSGGALVNLRGELVGINTAILAPNGSNVGIGFAIPSNMVNTVVVQLARHGKVRRGKLGVKLQDLTPKLADALNLKRTHGALITHVVSNSPAERSGIQPGDLVININQTRIKTARDMHNTLGLLSIDQAVNITLIRDGRSQTIRTTTAAPETLFIQGQRVNPMFAGASLSNTGGVLVETVQRHSPAERIGLRQGDLILSANRQQIKHVADLQQALRHQQHLRLYIQRGNSTLLLVVK